jgi:hypothetical protein
MPILTAFNAHRVTKIRLVPGQNGDTTWTTLRFEGEGTPFEVTVFTADGGPLQIEQPEDEDDEPAAPVWRDGAGYTAGERQDIADAGRGHLLR